MIVNQPIIELTKQVAVAVEEIKFSPTSASNNSNNGKQKLNSSSNNCDSPSSKSKSSSAPQTPLQQHQQPQQQQHYSANSLNPYYAQQVLLQYQKPATFVKHVHVVVKNTPFGITLKSKEPLQFNFQNYVIKATLLYDSDPPKMVDFIHNEPLQYVATVSEDGSEVTVDVKVGILSSQHQGSMFLVVLHVTHCSAPSPSNSEPIGTILTNIGNNSLHSLNLTNLCVVSHPIRIVSKLDHVKKEGIPILKKRTFHEILTDKLKKLQKSQDSQSKWIKNLYQQHGADFDMEPYKESKDSKDSKSSSLLLIDSSSSSSFSSNTSTPSFPSAKSNKKQLNQQQEEGDEDEDEEDEEDEDNESESSGSTQLVGKKINNNNNNNINNNNNNNNNTTTTTTISTSTINNNISNNINNPINSSNNFQNSFNRVVEVYNLIPDYEKPEMIRRMVEQLKSIELEQLVTTFIDELKFGYESTINSAQLM